MKIESISYKHGMLKKLSHKKRLRPAYFTGDEIPDEIETIIERNDILSLPGMLGSKSHIPTLRWIIKLYLSGCKFLRLVFPSYNCRSKFEISVAGN